MNNQLCYFVQLPRVATEIRRTLHHSTFIWLFLHACSKKSNTSLTASITLEFTALCNQHNDLRQYITSAKLKETISAARLTKCIHLITPQGKISLIYKKIWYQIISISQISTLPQTRFFNSTHHSFKVRISCVFMILVVFILF